MNSTKHRSRIALTFAVVTMATIGLLPSADAELLVYEPFIYADGWLTGRGGALGTTGVWTAHDTHNGDWRIHQQGDTSGVVISSGPPVERNMFDGTVNNLLTSGGYVGLPGPLDAGRDEGEDFEIGRYMDASIGLDPSVTATFQTGTTTWFSYVAVHGWDRNEETPYLTIGTDRSPNESRNSLYNLTNSGSGIGAGGGPPRGDRTAILPRYHRAGASYNLMGAATGWTDDGKNAPSATATMSWVASDDDGFGAANIIVGKIEWDADTGKEDIITVVRFLETDVLSESEFDALVAAKPDLSSANWTANKPNLDQSRFDTLNIAGTKFFVDEIRIGTTFADVVHVDHSSAERLVSALTALKHHVLNNPPLSSDEIAAHKATIDANGTLFGSYYDATVAAFDLVETYDTVIGPLFVSGSLVRSFKRSSVSDTDVHWVVYNVMQYIIDYSYTLETIASYPTLIDGFKFGSSAFFPGSVDSPEDPDTTYTVTVDASYPDTFGHDVMHQERPARRPTGAYLAPGSIVTLTVPWRIVGKGYQIRIGAHSWDFSNKPTIKRPDRSTIVYAINSSEIQVASPLGGGIYIEVPQYSYEGLINVTIKNAVRSPYFSKKSFHMTTLDEWRDTERHHPGPWADFQSEKFMMQVPTDWIYNFDDPVALMDKWDTAMDALDELMGFPEGSGKETMYVQTDLYIRASAYSPGYPSVNVKYNPDTSYGGNANHYLVKGPEHVPDYFFHEAGHGFLFVKFGGETESTVNLPHVAVWHREFGFDLDHAFAASRGYQGNPNRTLDNTAVAWMTSFNFSPREVPMASGEKAYQLKGHAKFVDTARLFGWKGLDAFWYSINEDYEDGIYWSRHGSDIDDLILRWCESVGVDLRPLFHFWGTHPGDASVLEAAVVAAKLPASAAIYDTLVHYSTLVPSDNQAFQAFALDWWGHKPSIGGYWTEREHARQWDNDVLWDTQELPNGEIYDESSCARIKAIIDGLLDLYFPGGRPSTDAGPNMITWSGQPVQLHPNVGGTPSTYTWSAEPDDGVLFSNPHIETPIVTITKATGNPSTVTLRLITTGGLNPVEGDTMTIHVYDDACGAAIGKGLTEDHPTDLNGDCITDFRDLSLMAARWLICTGLKEPIAK